MTKPPTNPLTSAPPLPTGHRRGKRAREETPEEMSDPQAGPSKPQPVRRSSRLSAQAQAQAQSHGTQASATQGSTQTVESDDPLPSVEQPDNADRPDKNIPGYYDSSVIDKLGPGPTTPPPKLKRRASRTSLTHEEDNYVPFREPPTPQAARTSNKGFNLGFLLKWEENDEGEYECKDPNIEGEPEHAFEYRDEKEFLQGVQKWPGSVFTLVRRLAVRYEKLLDSYADLYAKYQAKKASYLKYKDTCRDLEDEIFVAQNEAAEAIGLEEKITELEEENRRLIEYTTAWKDKCERRDATIADLNDAVNKMKSSQRAPSSARQHEELRPAHSPTRPATRVSYSHQDPRTEYQRPAQHNGQQLPVEQQQRRHIPERASFQPLDRLPGDHNRQPSERLPGDRNRDHRSPTYHTHHSTMTGMSAQSHPPKVADPPVFDGKDKSKFDEWMTKVKHKLAAEMAYYDSVEPSQAVNYVISRLEGVAFQAMFPRMPGKGHPRAFQNVREVLDALETHFGDHHREYHARDQYEKLKKSDREKFDDFYTRFQTCVFYFDKTEQDQIFELQAKLDYRLYREVNNGTQYRTVSELAEACRLQERIIEARDIRRTGTQRSKTSSSSYVKVSKPKTSAQSRSSNTSASTSRYSEPFPEKWRFGRMTQAVKDDLVKKKLCFDCRKSDHMAGDPKCEVAIWKNQHKLHAIHTYDALEDEAGLSVTEEMPPSEAVSDEVFSDSSESENYWS
ncbi:hypothetical protein ABEF95_014673 [Exophiala dermatitidis]